MAVMRQQMTVMLLLVACATIFGAASAVDLPALGGSSIQPSVFALLFLALRIGTSGKIASIGMERSIKDGLFLALFTMYGFLSAHIFPRLYYHQIELPPNRIVSSSIFAVLPLGPSSQNITQSVYLLGTLFVFLATDFIARTERRSRLVVMTFIWLSVAHLLFGIIDVAFRVVGIDALEFLRNANYAILTQSAGAFYRIKGTFPEASGYAAYGLVLLVFITELWLRDIYPRRTGWLAVALASVLTMTTSSSAYVGLAAYGLVLGLRVVYFQSPAMQRKGLLIAIFGLAALAGMLLMAVALPQVANAFTDMLEEMTIGKTQSLSGVQRGFWVQKSWEAFLHTKGVGVGVGSFRSSSLISAIAGSMGIVGLVTFSLFAYKVLPLHRMSTYALSGDKTEAVGSSAAWAAVVGLAPAMVAGANPDPGVLFAFLAGLALAWAPRGRASIVSGGARMRPPSGPGGRGVPPTVESVAHHALSPR